MNNKQLILTIFIACLVASNIIAIKIFELNGYFLPAGIIVFPITYIIGDVVTEVYGFKYMRNLIFYGFLANILVTGFILFSIELPPAPFWELQEEYELILSSTPRILVASMAGFLVGSLSNSWSMDYIKKLTSGKYLWLRTIGSTIIGEGLDTAIFILIAFSPVMDQAHLIGLLITQWVFKVLYETLSTPITYYVIGVAKKNNEESTL